MYHYGSLYFLYVNCSGYHYFSIEYVRLLNIIAGNVGWAGLVNVVRERMGKHDVR